MISAAMVKELREATGCGMMDCKKALTESDGNMEKAIEFLREKGLAAVAKKAGRIAAEGLVTVVVEGNVGAVVEVNSETDLVAKNAEFINFVDAVAKQVIKCNPADVEALCESKCDECGKTVREELNEKIATIGENMNIRRFKRYEGGVVGYVHGGGRIGVMVLVDGDLSNENAYTAARDIAMQIAAINPLYMSKDTVPANELESEKAIILAQMKEDPKNANKPENILEKMLTGKLNKFFEQNCLLQQPFVKDDSMKVSEYLAKNGVTLLDFVRFEKGEGLQKKEENFAEEVGSMVK